MTIKTVGLDLAKNVFQLHGVDDSGNVVLRRRTLRRTQVTQLFAQLPPCIIGIESCSSSQYWARKLIGLGHQARLIPPQFVKPYVKSNKNDANDAAAICEATGRPQMRFVPLKTPEQQSILAVHRIRESFVQGEDGLCQSNSGHHGRVWTHAPQGIGHVSRSAGEQVSHAADPVPGMVRDLVLKLLEHLRYLERRIAELELVIKGWHRHNADSQRLAGIPGVGVITATALVATIGDARQFKSGRHLAAWLGIVPRQHSSGGKERLLGISKRGDVYLRTLLIHGARVVLRHLTAPPHKVGIWLIRLGNRAHPNVVATALANRNARVVWALLVHKSSYDPALPGRACSG